MAIRIPYVSLPIDQSDVTYEHGPDSLRREGVPQGVTTEFTVRESTVYPGTERAVWIHRPATATSEPLPVIFFQDGWWYLDPDDDVRADTTSASFSVRTAQEQPRGSAPARCAALALAGLAREARQPVGRTRYELVT